MESVSELAATIRAGLERRGDPERAVGAKRYLKSELAFFGDSAPVLREVLREALGARAPLTREQLLALVRELWCEVFELRAAAVELLHRRAAVLTEQDLAFAEDLLRDSRTWALVDTLAVHVAGRLVTRFPALGDSLDRWACDADFWLRRSALLALLVPLREGGGDFERFTRYADGMLAEREFFIRKAIGWVLRETAKKRPELVEEFVSARLPRLAPLTLREAIKPLPAARRAVFLSALRSRRS